MPPTIFSYINTDTFAYLLQAVNSPYFLQVYVLLPLLLSAIMFNNGTANSLSLFTIVSIIALSEEYLTFLLAMSGTIRSFILDGGLTATEVTQALQYLDPLIRTLYTVVCTYPYFISFLQGVGFEAYADQAILLNNSFNEMYRVYLDLSRDLHTILQNIPQPPH